jgi:SAM-dependent methyltransferase
LVQAIVTSSWEEAVGRIYDSYSIYAQGGGAEQRVFPSHVSGGSLRSEALLGRVSSTRPLPVEGRLLDVGCGNGSLLKVASKLLPQWRLWGTEVNDKCFDQLREIRGVEQLVAGKIQDVPGVFDLITLIHVLEHIPSPTAFLTELAQKLAPGGVLLVQVPDAAANPFTLLVADHCSHFSAATLSRTVHLSGVSGRLVAGNWVPRELTMLADRTNVVPAPPLVEQPPVEHGLSWLRNVRDTFRSWRDTVPMQEFGIFGTAIAGTWLDSELGSQASFFVDEDVARAGRDHLGRQILAPDQAPQGSVVLVALTPAVAQSVSVRLENAGLRPRRPPSFQRGLPGNGASLAQGGSKPSVVPYREQA